MTRGTAYLKGDLDGEGKKISVLEPMKVLDRGDQGNGVSVKRPGRRSAGEQWI